MGGLKNRNILSPNSGGQVSESKVWVEVLAPSEGFGEESVPGLSPSSVWRLLFHHPNPPSPQGLPLTRMTVTGDKEPAPLQDDLILTNDTCKEPSPQYGDILS